MKVHSFAFVPRRRLCTAFLRSARTAACQLCSWTGTCWGSVAAGVRGRDVLRHENEPIFPWDLGKWVLPFPGRTATPVAQLLRWLWGRAEPHEGCPWNCSQGFLFPRKRCSFSFSYLKQKQNLMTEGAWFLFSGNLLDFLISAECVMGWNLHRSVHASFLPALPV